MTTRRALLVTLVTLPALALAGVAAVQTGAVAWGPDPTGLPLEQRYAQAATWEEFLAANPDRAEAWRAEYDAAAPAVTALRDEPLGSGVARETGGVAGANAPWRLLVVSEPWCGDSRRAVPYLARLADERDDLELRLVSKADAPDLLAAYPHPDGRTAIPLVLVLDADDAIRGAWVEQPAPMRALIATESGRLPGDRVHELVLAWHRDDGGRSLLGEIMALIRAADHAGLTPPPGTASPSRPPPARGPDRS